MVTMPPGMEAPCPPPTKPTTSSVRPGMMTNRGQPYWVRSMPNRTTPRANRPTTTSTIPSAPLDPPPGRRSAWAFGYTGGAAAGANIGLDSTGSATTGSMGFSVAVSGTASETTGTETTSDGSAAGGSFHFGAKMSGL